MRLFAVRKIEDREPVGFFWAKNSAELARMAGSVLAPRECEYKPITKPTAIMFIPGGHSRPAVGWKMGVKAAWSDDDPNGVVLASHLTRVNETISFDNPMFDWPGNMSTFVNGRKDVTGWTRLGAPIKTRRRYNLPEHKPRE